MSYNSDLSKVIKRAEEQGFRHERLTNNHHRFKSPDGRGMAVHGGTPSDNYRGWANFMADMRRIGYKEDDMFEETKRSVTTNLGEAIKAAIQQPGTDEESRNSSKPQRGTLPDFIRDHFRNHPDKSYEVDAILMLVRAKGYDFDEKYVGTTIARLYKQGELVRVSRGLYRWPRKSEPAVVTDVVGVPTPTTRVQLVPEVPAPLSSSSEITEDEKELDEALAALGRIEALVRKHKVKARQFNALKELLNKVNA